MEQDSVCYPLLKVGMATRNIEERTTEICRDLDKFGSIQNIEVLGFFDHFGSLEKRLLTLMQLHQLKLGSLAEYSDVLSISPHLLNEDIRNLGKRKVNGHECSATYRHHQRKIRGGRRRFQLINDRHLGRPSTSTPRNYRRKVSAIITCRTVPKLIGHDSLIPPDQSFKAFQSEAWRQTKQADENYLCHGE
ncbi:hypothetical protein [Vibrio owensii]|uniref:hypothetical protein n=1 Tax=Vibrio owensii TaxID=696485 RepID=UPI003AAAAD9D